MIVFGGFGVKPPEDEEDDEDDEGEGNGEGEGEGDVGDEGEGEGEDEEEGEGEESEAKGPSVDMTWFADAYALEVRVGFEALSGLCQADTTRTLQ